MKISEQELAKQHLQMRAELTALRKYLSYMIEKHDNKEFDAFSKVFPDLVRKELLLLLSDLEWSDQDLEGFLKDLMD